MLHTLTAKQVCAVVCVVIVGEHITGLRLMLICAHSTSVTIERVHRIEREREGGEGERDIRNLNTSSSYTRSIHCPHTPIQKSNCVVKAISSSYSFIMWFLIQVCYLWLYNCSSLHPSSVSRDRCTYRCAACAQPQTTSSFCL